MTNETKNTNKFSTTKGFVVGAIATFAVLAASATFAYRGDGTGINHEAMDKAFESAKVEDWRTQVSNLKSPSGRTPRVVEVVDTQEEYDKLKELHVLMEDGKIEEANEIRSELGLGNGQGKSGGGMGKMGGQGRGMRGTNTGGNFVDTNGDGECDNLSQES